MQETIKKKFEKCTLIVISHRIRTIADSDTIAVLENGACKEIGNQSACSVMNTHCSEN